MTIEEFLENLQGVEATASGYTALCPAHQDRHPSLVVTEAADRTLVHCRAGCPTRDVLAALGLDYADLFLDHGKTKRTHHRTRPHQPERLPSFFWNWRSQCAELERLTQWKRENAEGMLAATQGLDVNALAATEFDEVMDLVARAYDWLARCGRLDETVFALQQVLRAEERQQHTTKGRKAAA